MIKTSSYQESLREALLDPAEAAAYLDAAMEDSEEAFLVAVRNVAQAQQMTKVAKEAGIQRETLYRSLSGNGNPTLSTLSSVLRCVGLRLSVRKIKPKRTLRSKAAETQSGKVKNSKPKRAA